MTPKQDPSVYVGSELDLFSNAINWKSYFASRIKPWIKGNVLEIGAGIGETTRALSAGHTGGWTCVEPDPQLAARIDTNAHPKPRVIVGTLEQLPRNATFDTIIYIDVLEHIEDDAAELSLAAKYLAPNGRIICLCPAYMFLYSAFDKSIGHYRRYTKTRYRKITPASLVLDKTFYLDALGCALSAANRFMLKQSVPNVKQILFWDRTIIPISKCLDPLVLRSFGRSVVAVWRRSDTQS